MSLIYTSSNNSSSPSGGASSVNSSGIISKRNSIYIGGRADAKSLDKLDKWNISHILNVTTTKDSSVQAGVPNFFERKGRFTYKRIPIYDSPTSVTQLENHIDDIIKFISNGLFHGSVLVHCQHGVSRSTTCVVLYLMNKVKLSLQDSMKIIQRRRPEAKPIPAFYQLLQRYETKLINNNKRDATALGGGGGGEETKMKMKKKKTKKSTAAAAAMMIGPAIGPSIGPAIGPTMMTRPQQIGPAIGPTMKGAPPTKSEKEASSRKRMIGPSIGPVIMENDDLSTTTTTTTQPSSSSSSSSSAIIGPAIGPEMKKRKKIPSSSLTSKTTEPIIGPAIGPPEIMKEEPERPSSSSLLSSPSTTKKEE